MRGLSGRAAGPYRGRPDPVDSEWLPDDVPPMQDGQTPGPRRAHPGTPVADPSWRERPGVLIVGVS